MQDTLSYINKACSLLRDMVAVPAPSFDEGRRADFICDFLNRNSVETTRIGNNIIARMDGPQGSPTLLLNSHIDTVPAAEGYTFDPFNPPEDQERIPGLGSNDAGASVVSLIAAFLFFSEHRDLCPCSLCLALSCEEERSGKNGMSLIAPELADFCDFAIIGEPTQMKAAVAERGLLVLDGYAEGISAHVAHSELGDNALLKALKDINKLQNFTFSKVSRLMGETKLNVTQIESGNAHNVIPDKCHFVVDIRPTEMYGNEEIVAMLQKEVSSRLVPRNIANHSSATPKNHILAKTASRLGAELIVSKTTSDWMRLTIPAIKMGPGDSDRSHKSDEFVYKSEIASAINFYIDFIKNIK